MILFAVSRYCSEMLCALALEVATRTHADARTRDRFILPGLLGKKRNGGNSEFEMTQMDTDVTDDYAFTRSI